MRVQSNIYLWRWEPFDPAGGTGTGHDELKRDLGNTGEQQPEEGDDTGVEASDP
jgi:hypothetical protein